VFAIEQPAAVTHSRFVTGTGSRKIIVCSNATDGQGKREPIGEMECHLPLRSVEVAATVV
jgi:hypothetical protein